MTTECMNEKIEALLGRLTLEEKIRMIHGAGLFRTGEVERLGIPSVKMSDGPMGVRHEFPDASWVPVGNSDDYVTYCPSNSAIAATWNRKLAYAAGHTLGEEARGRGKDVILAPGINIKRVPVCGRNFEYMSEDPYLTAQMVVPMIQGIQESDVAACVKHFALNSQEIERVWVNVEIDERALREIYLPAFQAAVQEGGAASVMGAYNLFRGTHCCENKTLLDDILRKEWGFDGMVVSDWGGIHDTNVVAHASMDIDMSVTTDFDAYCMAEPLKHAVEQGEIEESCVDAKVRNIIRMMLRLKMIDVAWEETQKEQTAHAVRCPDRKSGSYNTPEHRQSTLETARESVVLLKNEEKILPLHPEKLQKLLVIGDNAERLHALGGGSAEIKALYEISPLMGLKSQLGGNCEVTFARGYYITPKEIRSDVSWQENSVEEFDANSEFVRPHEQIDEETPKKQRELREEAVALAKDADAVVLIGGLNHDYDVEGYDRPDIKLPYAQDELIQAVLNVRPDTVIVMLAGSPVDMSVWKDQAKAIVWSGYCGMEGGNALAEVLLGKVNPSGKLTESIPYRLEDCAAIALGEYPGNPLTAEQKTRMHAHLTETYRDGLFVGYRYYEKFGIPVQFCFGHGLSYTEFAYENLHLSQNGDTVAVGLDVHNVGAVAGSEVVQVYVGKTDCGSDEPVKQLRGFDKITLLPGEQAAVEIQLPASAFSSYHAEQAAFAVDAGQYCISIGSSLEDIRLRGTVSIAE
ncbi:glycoside hydrolase family 3 C-terminal domain-containing protein [Butyricicoccus sp.]|uniref:glycoside hydrolase family 3 C-terminal domain-containing protein n=1 Tax=Butyricicoccus sp. TaxID=2049021 RepID=UPI003F16DBA1